MFQISAHGIQDLQGGDGQRLAQCVDALLRTRLAEGGITQAHIHTDHKSQQDGGVDTSIDVGDPNDPLGYTTTPTCWQYKATAHTKLRPSDIRKEIQKDFCASLIKKGYAWRLVIPDEMGGDKHARWVQAAREEIQKLNKKAPEPLIITASALSQWVSGHPGVVLRFFPVPTGAYLDLRSWEEAIRSDTPTYVQVPSWGENAKTIRSHVELANTPKAPVLTIQGEAGVGKTRLVFETLNELGNARELVVYTESADAAEKLTYYLARTTDSHCLLVVDECAPETRASLGRILNGVQTQKRVRVIAIDNSGLPASAASFQSDLPMMEDDELANVLAENFPQVPKDNRREYARVSKGFVRLAADLCANDPLASSAAIRASGGLRQYIEDRVRDRWDAVAALSLVRRVGWRDDAEDEFSALCGWLGLDTVATRKQLLEIKDRPGFVKDIRRFAYVSPEIVAQLGFAWAWKRWADPNVNKFLADVPDALLNAFLKRVDDSAGHEVRRLVGEYFRSWIAQLTIEDLQDADKAKRATLVTEAHLDTALPLLAKLIETASLDDLREIKGSSIVGWGPRRHLVWMLERAARLPHCFHSAERILRRLACAESEPGIGNNASAIYRQFFRIYLSGTPVPFEERSGILEKILQRGDPEESKLAVAALRTSLSDHGMRMVGPVLVGGQVPPNEWQPASREELNQAHERVIDLLRTTMESPIDSVRDPATGALVSVARKLLYRGYLERLKVAVGPEAIESHGPELLREINAYLRWDAENEQLNQAEQYVRDVRAWFDSVVPADLHGRLIRYVGRWLSRLDTSDEPEEWSKEVVRLAEELATQPDALRSELDWLLSAQANGAPHLGYKIGERDPDGRHLPVIIQRSAAANETGLARGYCAGYMSLGAENLQQISDALDAIEGESPAVAFEISTAVESLPRSIERTRTMVRSNALRPAAFSSHRFMYGSEKISIDDASKILEALVAAAKEQDQVSLRGAVHLLGAWVQKSGQLHLFADPDFRDLAWQVLEATTTTPGAEGHWWGETIRHLSSLDPERGIALCAQTLITDSIALNDEAETELVRLARQNAAAVMDSLGAAMLDDARGWVFHVADVGGLVASLPLAEVKRWLDSTGVEGARRIARHVPRPTVGADGEASLHPLTHYVLTEFEDDDRTFNEFVAGTHSMQIYRGDIASQHQAQADAARPLLTHDLRRVREWAKHEVERGEADAEMWRRREAEQEIDF